MAIKDLREFLDKLESKGDRLQPGSKETDLGKMEAHSDPLNRNT